MALTKGLSPNNHSLSLVLILTAISLLVSQVLGQTKDHEHAQFLKDFVPDHPHLHELVDKAHQGDLDAKHKFERESLSTRFNKTKASLPAQTDEEHVVLHFLDEYSSHVTGGNSDHKFMTLDPFIDMLKKEDHLRVRLIKLGERLEAADCDMSCLSSEITGILNDSIDKLSPTRQEL